MDDEAWRVVQQRRDPAREFRERAKPPPYVDVTGTRADVIII
jgi:hypothetical protein